MLLYYYLKEYSFSKKLQH